MKTLFPRLVLAALVAMAFSFPMHAADSPSVLLQKGIYAEETEGNVDAAIKIYEQIAAEAATNRAVVAQAQYRLAVCYQKKGNKEQAIKLLNELVQQFPSDAAVLRKARSTLTELGAPAAEGMTVRKLPFSVPGWPEAMSQDGRFVAYEPKGGYDLAVFEIATGKTWIIAKCVEGKSPSFIAISPDGEQIAYDLSDSTIYLAKIDGSETRKLLVIDDKTEDVWPSEWAQDSSRLFIDCKQRSTGSYRIVAVQVRTGATQEIARMPTGDLSGTGILSADGQYLARRRGSYPRRISILDLKSGREETVVATDAGNIVGWVPSNAKLAFLKNRGTTSDLLAVGIKDGKPVGEPEVLHSNFPNTGPNAQPLGITRDGGIYYFVRKDRSEPSELWLMEGFLAAKPPVARTESWRIQTDIPTDEMILGADNSILDRKFGFGATLPTGWTVSSAVRQGNGGTVVQFQSSELREASARPRIIYWPTNPWANPGSPANDFAASGAKPTTPEEIDAWLRNRVLENIEAYSKLGDHMTKVEGQVSKVINGHRALTVTGNYARSGKSRSEVFTLVYSDSVIGHFDIQAPAEKFEAIRPSYERLVESIRLP